VTGCPIKFLGVGEKVEDIEVFYPERIANRILGMGDIVSLVEKVSEDLKKEEIEELEDSLKKGQFTFNDYLKQIRQMKKIGGMGKVLGMIPGISKIKKQLDEADIDENILNQQEAVILSMTPKERENPKIIDGSRKKRIAHGAGTEIALVNKLLKQHKMMTNMMKKMSQGGGRNFGGPDGIPPELFNNLK
jgi:signal recognition particle subunit SRP54